jgi:hypothetical protein
MGIYRFFLLLGLKGPQDVPHGSLLLLLLPFSSSCCYCFSLLC